LPFVNHYSFVQRHNNSSTFCKHLECSAPAASAYHMDCCSACALLLCTIRIFTHAMFCYALFRMSNLKVLWIHRKSWVGNNYIEFHFRKDVHHGGKQKTWWRRRCGRIT